MGDHYENEVAFLVGLDGTYHGIVKYKQKEVSAVLELSGKSSLIKVNDSIELRPADHHFSFESDQLGAEVTARISINEHSAQTNETFRIVSSGPIDSLVSNRWRRAKSIFRSYLKASNKKILYELCGRPGLLKLEITKVPISIRQIDKYLVVENDLEIEFDLFSEICYSTLVALGFLSGHFVQDESYTFQQLKKGDKKISGYRYERLRRSSVSIYHPVTANPFGYEGFIGKDVAEELYSDKTLKNLNAKQISKLAELIHLNPQIQYAIVLFNEANDNDLSLLVKNNSFFVVLEVLRKYFHTTFKHKLPTDYSQKVNVEKFKLVFECITPTTEEELLMLAKRNLFMHGDVKNLEGTEMVSIMQKQITFIYKYILAHIGFKGHVIDHFSIRNNPSIRSFIKIP